MASYLFINCLPSPASWFLVCVFLLSYFKLIRQPASFTLFPYTTLFRSARPPGVYGSRRARQWRSRAGSRREDRKSTRLNSSHRCISYDVLCLEKKSILLVAFLPDYKESSSKNKILC